MIAATPSTVVSSSSRMGGSASVSTAASARTKPEAAAIRARFTPRVVAHARPPDGAAIRTRAGGHPHRLSRAGRIGAADANAETRRMRKTSDNNIAARAGRWSAQNRKTAIVGWLVFVILAVFAGGSVGTQTLGDDDYEIGESGRADSVVSDHFRDKESESVLVQSQNGARTDDAEFRQVVDTVVTRLENTRNVRNVQRAELTSLPITLIILILAFGALLAAFVPLVLAITAVAAAIGLIGPISQIWPVEETINSVVLLIGLAVGVDYALFYLRCEREERAAGRSEDGALQTAAATSGRAVLISGLTVMIAMAGMYLAGSSVFGGFATGTILVVAVAMVGSLTVLPAVLSKLGDRVMKGRVPFLARRRESGRESRVWGAVLDRVLRRPRLAAVVAGGALVALSVPAFSLHTAALGADGLPQHLPIVKTVDRMERSF